MNVYDSEKIDHLLNENLNSSSTNEIETADIIILNTCSVREKAQEKLFSEIGKYKKLKIKNPNLIIGVGGCVGSQEGEKIISREPLVDVVFGPQSLHKIHDLIKEKNVNKKKVIDTSMNAFDKFDSLPMPSMGKVSSYISIMEGCNKFCSYCIVPFTRGEEISRPFEQIVKEAVRLSKLGTKEIVLLGQNVNGYHVNENNESIEFSKLTNYLSLIKGLERIRFTTSHPKHFFDNEIDLIFSSEKMAKHLHLPLQSGSNTILKSMKRGYTIEHYRRIVNKINKKDPTISLTSDFIVGFPGETDADFDATYAVIEEFKFDQSFFFAYSPRPGTPSSLICDSVPKDLKQKRLKTLLDLNKKHVTEHNLKLLDKEEVVIVEGHSKKNPKELYGRTSSNKIINFPGKISNIGNLVNVKINQLKTHTLSGFILGE